jgi:hypothetical protein
MKLAGIPVLLLLILAVPRIAEAQISLSISTEVDSAKLPDLSVVVRVLNGGKESAHRLRATIQAGSEKVTLPEAQDLKPNQNHEFIATIPTKTAKTGTYPVLVTIAYADLNGYSFSALASSSFSVGAASASDIVGVLSATPVSDKGEFRLKLKNNSNEERVVALRPFLPLELTPGGLPASVTLASGAEQELMGTIANFSALGGSRYPIFISAEYETADRHFTNMVTTFVDILSPQSTFSRYQNWLIGLAAVLLLAAVWQKSKGRKSRRLKSESARAADGGR